VCLHLCADPVDQDAEGRHLHHCLLT
jgi:hypothetical protein